MLFTIDFTSLDEAAAGFPVDPVPPEICQRLFRSITTPPSARRVSTKAGGATYVATWAGEDRIRIASLLSTEIVAETIGPGSELKAILQFFGIREKPGCKCRQIARWMNEAGPRQCWADRKRLSDASTGQIKCRPLRWLARMAFPAMLWLSLRRARG